MCEKENLKKYQLPLPADQGSGAGNLRPSAWLRDSVTETSECERQEATACVTEKTRPHTLPSTRVERLQGNARTDGTVGPPRGGAADTGWSRLLPVIVSVCFSNLNYGAVATTLLKFRTQTRTNINEPRAECFMAFPRPRPAMGRVEVVRVHPSQHSQVWGRKSNQVPIRKQAGYL